MLIVFPKVILYEGLQNIVGIRLPTAFYWRHKLLNIVRLKSSVQNRVTA